MPKPYRCCLQREASLLPSQEGPRGAEREGEERGRHQGQLSLLPDLANAAKAVPTSPSSMTSAPPLCLSPDCALPPSPPQDATVPLPLISPRKKLPPLMARNTSGFKRHRDTWVCTKRTENGAQTLVIPRSQPRYPQRPRGRRDLRVHQLMSGSTKPSTSRDSHPSEGRRLCSTLPHG